MESKLSKFAKFLHKANKTLTLAGFSLIALFFIKWIAGCIEPTESDIIIAILCAISFMLNYENLKKN